MPERRKCPVIFVAKCGLGFASRLAVHGTISACDAPRDIIPAISARTQTLQKHGLQDRCERGGAVSDPAHSMGAKRHLPS
jgi:hypothetical protein